MTAGRGHRSSLERIKAWAQLARIHQYVKNVFVFSPLFFGYKLLDLEAVFRTFAAFAFFCAAASSIYALNDLTDLEEDRKHPVKSGRPLASGALKRSDALIFMGVTAAFALGPSLFLLPFRFVLVVLAYLALNVLYSRYLKHKAIIDVVCISIGFVLRVLAGGIAADVTVSQWIIIMTFLLALFLAFAKRRDDLLVAAGRNDVRKSLDGYSLELISLSMGVMASVIIVSYVLYTMSPSVIERHGGSRLYLSSIWVIMGTLRYLQITFVEERSGTPSLLLLKDRFLHSVVLLWALNCYLLLYGGWK